MLKQSKGRAAGTTKQSRGHGQTLGRGPQGKCLRPGELTSSYVNTRSHSPLLGCRTAPGLYGAEDEL